MKEIYKVKPPERIVFGDPMYFEQCKKGELKRLTVDYKPPDSFRAKVVLEETPYEECPDEMFRAMSIYFAPSQTIDVYAQGKQYESQDYISRDIGVDSARYLLGMDGNYDIFSTGGDGYWGEYAELFRTVNGKQYVDAVIITVVMPEYETMEDMRKWLKYFFKEIEAEKLPTQDADFQKNEDFNIKQ